MWLADDAEMLERLLGVRGERLFVHDLPEADASLWRALSSADVVWGQAGARGFWRHVHVVGEAPGSQYDVLASGVGSRVRLAGPAACLALRGRGFHGHRGRGWSAEAGNIHLSAAIPAHLPAASVGLALTMLPAVAVLDACDVATGGRVRPDVKWVNDLLVDGAKLAGVLTTTRTGAETVDLVVVGIGLNVERTPEIDATVFVPRATCLREAGADLDLGAVVVPLLAALAARYRALEQGGPGGLYEAYRARSLVLGRAVRIWDEAVVGRLPAASLSGVVLDLAPDLALVIRGVDEVVRRGRLALEEDCLAFGI